MKNVKRAVTQTDSIVSNSFIIAFLDSSSGSGLYCNAHVDVCG